MVDGTKRVLGEDEVMGVGVEAVLEEADGGLDGNIKQGGGAEELWVMVIVKLGVPCN